MGDRATELARETDFRTLMRLIDVGEKAMSRFKTAERATAEWTTDYATLWRILRMSIDTCSRLESLSFPRDNGERQLRDHLKLLVGEFELVSGVIIDRQGKLIGRL